LPTANFISPAACITAARRAPGTRPTRPAAAGSTSNGARTAGVANPVLLPGSAASDPDSWFVGDSVSGYRDGNSYRIMYTGYAEDLFGTEGRFEGICLASVTATCP
jgi:hypothetical protein